MNNKQTGGGLHKVTFLLLAIGGLNWLVQGIFSWEIGRIFGGIDALVSRIIYILIGLSAVYELFTHRQVCHQCQAPKSTTETTSPPSPPPEQENQPPTGQEAASSEGSSSTASQ